jgi:hypothetical protein
MRLVFRSCLKQYASVVVLCAVCALGTTLATFPFIFTADGDIRWQAAMRLLRGETPTSLLVAPLPVLCMAATFFLTHSYATYTFAQSLVMLLSLAWLVHQLMRCADAKEETDSWIIAVILIVLCPLTLVFSVILTDSSGALSGLSFALSLLGLSSPGQSRITRTLYYSAVVIALTIAFGFRANCLATIPAFLFIIYCLRNSALNRRVIESFCLALAFVISITVPRLMAFPAVHPETLGWTWELVGITKSAALQDVQHSLNTIGNSTEAIAHYNSRASNDLFWGQNAPFPALALASPDTSRLLRRIYVETLLHHTRAFLAQKLAIADGVLAINEPLLHPLRGVHFMDGIGGQYGVTGGAQRELVHGIYLGAFDALEWIALRPLTLLVVALLLLGAAYAKARPVAIRAMPALLVAVTYYCSYLMNCQAMEFRYFAPAFFLLSIVCVCLTYALARIVSLALPKILATAAGIWITCVCASYVSGSSPVHAANMTDGNWTRGVSVSDNVVLFDNTLSVRRQLSTAKTLHGLDGSAVTIVSYSIVSGDWIQVRVAAKQQFLYSPSTLIFK